MKQKVIFIGFQERLHRLPVALVNDASGNTAVYDREKHVIVNPLPYIKALCGELRIYSGSFAGYAVIDSRTEVK